VLGPLTLLRANAVSSEAEAAVPGLAHSHRFALLCLTVPMQRSFHPVHSPSIVDNVHWGDFEDMKRLLEREVAPARDIA
jgi:hypothetical protein